MSTPIQPLSLLPLPHSIEAKGFSVGPLQQALALQPALASQAVGQVMAGAASASPLPLTSTPAALNALSGPKNHTDAELKKISKNFEAIFMRMLFKEMRNSVQKSGIFGNSHSLEFFETMRDEQLSEKLAAAGGLGIGNMVYQKLKAATVPHQKSFR
jgi:hypothetical protein